MSQIEAKLAEMGFELPEPWPYPSPNRTAVVQVGPVLYVSGHGPGSKAARVGMMMWCGWRRHNGVGGDRGKGFVSTDLVC